MVIGTFGSTAILPPRCMRKVRSETLWTETPSSASIAATTASPWATSAHATVTSRTVRPSSTRTRSIAPRIAPVSPIAPATFANDPAVWGSCTRMVTL